MTRAFFTAVYEGYDVSERLQACVGLRLAWIYA
jgi:hypothetical protein